MKHIRNIKEIFVVLCLMITLALTYNYFSNTHTHQLSSGFEVSHAHPMAAACSTETTNNSTGHTHTDSQLLLIDQLNITNVLPLLALVFLAILLAVFTPKARTEYQFSVVVHESNSLCGRAPPVLF